MTTTEYALGLLLALAVGAWAGYKASRWIWEDDVLIEGYQMARFAPMDPEPEPEPDPEPEPAWVFDEMLDRG